MTACKHSHSLHEHHNKMYAHLCNSHDVSLRFELLYTIFILFNTFNGKWEILFTTEMKQKQKKCKINIALFAQQ